MIRRWFFAAALISLVPAIAFAQIDTGVIVGTVRDSSGAAVPGATVRLVNGKTLTTVDAVSDEHGLFRADGLPPGPYRLETTLDGFEAAVQQVVLEDGRPATVELTLIPARLTEGVVVTARRVEEAAQDVPIPLSVLNRNLVENAGAFNVNRLKELIPTVQFYSTNPRNSAINIRGLGAPFGLTNDGLEPGVGLYIDGVFYARPASATLDFLDVERIEVLRGPQGTLFGKNTTAGAINVTTRKPSFTREGDFELNVGDRGFVQAKASLTSPLGKKVAGRLSFSGTQRDGTLFNVRSNERVNDLDNAGIRGQLLIAPSDKVAILFSTDYSRQRPRGYTQVVAGVAPTLRPANRQYAQIAADLQYTPPSFNAFDRVTDVDVTVAVVPGSQWLGSEYRLEGGPRCADVDQRLALLELESFERPRFHWRAGDDGVRGPVKTASVERRDSLRGCPVSAPELRCRRFPVPADDRFRSRIQAGTRCGSGAFSAFTEPRRCDPGVTRRLWIQSIREIRKYERRTFRPGRSFAHRSSAFASGTSIQLRPEGRRLRPAGVWRAADQRSGAVALQQSILAPQKYEADIHDTNLSGQLSAAYSIARAINVYATYATGFKSVGLNLNGVPTDAANQPVIAAASVEPEDVRNIEVGLKTELLRGVTANLTAYVTRIDNFQTQVTNASVGVLRGYLANAEKVRVRGAELDAHARLNANLSFYGAAAYTDGQYVAFPDAPPPLEETGGPAFKDISGSVLPGVSKWAFSVGGEYARPQSLFGRAGQVFGAADASYRSSFSSNASYSRYLIVAGYSLVNVRLGFRAANGWSVFLWSRNLLNKEYFELLTATPGNTGLYVGQPGDGRTVGLTLRLALKKG